MLSCSVLEDAWLNTLSVYQTRPYLFLAAGVFICFEEKLVKQLVLTLRNRFPGAELVFDAYSPFMLWSHNIRVTRKGIGARLYWALKNGQYLERWSEGIHLLHEMFPFQSQEPQIRRALKVRLVPFLVKVIGVFHYKLKGGRHV